LQNFGALSEFINVEDLANRLIETLQPVVGEAGKLVRSIATGAAVSIYKVGLVLIISYFILADSKRLTEISDVPEIPDYAYDFHRLGRELRRVWNAFLRGQLVIFVMVVFVNTIVLSVLGVRYSIGLALLTGLSRFLPYIGPVITATVMALATFFQSSNYLGLGPWQYMILVVAVAYVIDLIFDNLIQPRFFGDVLGVHPAALLVVAIVAANLMGLVGLVLAAPVLATLQVIGGYVFRKMFDLDPWPEPEKEPDRIEYPWMKWGRVVWKFLQKGWKKIRSWIGSNRSDFSDH
jgi:predicted PurR-regulated permease PerM